MSIKTNLSGRLRNTSLPVSHGLMPLFEAVVNSIHSIEENQNQNTKNEIKIEVLRLEQKSLDLKDLETKERIVGFKITDTGAGFNDDNMKSFETLDSDHKFEKGCRGVGRLLWLKAFDQVDINSIFVNKDNKFVQRKFSFDDKNGVVRKSENILQQVPLSNTVITLTGYKDKYRIASPKKIDAIAKSLLEHCLWYFVREGSCPNIRIFDGSEYVDLEQVYDEYMHSSAKTETLTVKEQNFEITHLKFRASSAKTHSFSYCAANRLVKEESLNGKIPGLFGNINDEAGEFIYSCYVMSPYLDEKVRSERTGFDLEDNVEGLLGIIEISLKDIRDAIFPKIQEHLSEALEKNIAAGRNRVEKFVANKAPRYRPIISRIPEKEIAIDASISDKELDLLLHKYLAEIERQIINNSHNVSLQNADETDQEYYKRVQEYLVDVTDIKKSDLADYLCHRKVIIDLLEKSLERDSDGKYVRESIIHELIMPMGHDSDSVMPRDCNLWLIDEKLAFHDYLASDKPIKSMPITGGTDGKEPDIAGLQVYDNPVLMSENSELPLASIVVVEIKRPMRNDASAGEEKDPLEQALGYFDRIRTGKVTTKSGRPIPNNDNIPGFCYVVCDLTESVKKRAKLMGLTLSDDYMGYFGYNQNYKAYVEVIAFDKLVDNAKKRNRTFFDKLGLATS